MTTGVREACPECGSQLFKKNGQIHNGRQNPQGKDCSRPFVWNATNRVIEEEPRAVGERLRREKISLHGICRAIGVSSRWLMDLMSTGFAAVPEHLQVQPVASSGDVIVGGREGEADELGSFGHKKTNKQGVGMARDKRTRQIIAFHVGDRSRDSAKQWWANIPQVSREPATFYTDHYEAYGGVIPARQHQAIPKHARKTNHIERFKNTLRQRVSRLVRHPLAFSKNTKNHVGALRYFICHYNLTRAALLV